MAEEMIYRRRNRERVREWMTGRIGATNRECAAALGIGVVAVGRHVQSLRAEWSPPNPNQGTPDDA